MRLCSGTQKAGERNYGYKFFQRRKDTDNNFN